MRCRQPSCSVSSPTAPVSPSSATMPRRSTAFAPPMCAISSIFPATSAQPADVVTLEENYRSTAADSGGVQCGDRSWPATVSARTCARTGLATTSHRWSRSRDDVAQVSFVVENVLCNREDGTPRKNKRSCSAPRITQRMLEIELARRNIPFVKFGGLKFVEAAHVKDVLAVLRWAENPADRVTGFRVVQVLDGIGPTTAGKLLEHLRDRPFLAALATFAPPAKAASAWHDLVSADAAGSARRAAIGPHNSIRCGSGTSRICSTGMPMPSCAPATSISCSASPPAIPSRCQFLTDLTLDPPSATSD